MPEYNVLDLFKAGGVERYHTDDSIPSQTVSEHSWGVALLVVLFIPDPSVNLLKAAILHDTPEYWTGDIPAHVKWRYLEFRDLLKDMEKDIILRHNIPIPELTKFEKSCLKACDYLEILIYAYRNTKHFLDTGDVLHENMNHVIQTILLSAEEHLPELVGFTLHLHDQYKRLVTQGDNHDS